MADQLMLGTTGGNVAILLQRLVVLGIEVPSVERRGDYFGPGTEAAIRRFQAETGLPITGVVDEATARALGLAGMQPRSIQGVVCRPDGTLLEGIAVRLYQQGLRGEKVAAETRSGSDGGFSLPWPDGITAGLTVRTDGGAGKAVSSAVASASGATWVRLSVGGEYRGATRFAMLMAAVTPRLDDAPLHTVGDNGRASELKVISEGAGVPGPEVSRLVLAHKLAAETKIDAAVFFALFAQRIPAALTSALEPDGKQPVVLDDIQVAHVLDTILQLRSENVRAALQAAVDDNTIADSDIDAAAKQLPALRIKAIGARPYRVGKTPFRDVLATSISDPAAQERVFEAFAAYGASPDFWADLEKAEGFTAEKLADLRFTLRTTILLRNHLPLLRHVQKLRVDKTIASTSDLARLDEADWGKLLRETDPKGEHLTFTANLKFKTVDERIDHFAQMLAAQFERRHPTAAFAGRLAKDRGELKLAAPQGVQRFLDSSRSFSLQRTHIDRFLQDNGPSTLAGADDATQVVADLKKIQRVYKLTPRFAHAKAMLAAGHTSAHSVYATGRKRFVDTLSAAGATRSAARAIYARATQAHATTLALLGNFNSALTSVAPSAVAQPLAAATLQPMLASYPNLQSLFGANDYCSCEHCRAIYGPAAYLVDILQFLKLRTASTGTARDVLFARRPDLGAIELSCDNTNGIVPYIDLACEVLEDAVSAPNQDTVRARQTSGSPEELRANPRFVNEAAYTTLRNAVFPHAAPFDLWTAEVRAFLRQLGVPWHDLLAAFQVPAVGTTPASPLDTQIAGERLGFNARALTLVTTAAPAQPWTHWGLQETNNAVPDPRKPNDTTAVVTGTWLQVLAFVPILLHRADLRHRELVQLLATRFINPNGAIKIVVTSADGFASCDTGKQTIETWTADALSRFNRFVRLWRQLGCTIWDLDKVLTTASVGNNAIDATAIRQIGRFEQIASRLGVPWDELLGLWSDVDRFSYLNVLDDSEPVMKSVYARRFRNATVTQSSSVFVEDPTALQGPLGSAEAVAGISAALNLSGDDIQRIRAAAGLDAATTALNLTNLSILFRYAILAGGLQLSVAELVIAIGVTGVNPFTSPAKTLEFLGALEQARNSGFTLQELHYLLRHGSALDSGIALADSTIAGWLEDLRKGLVRLGSGGDEFVVRRISDLLSLDPALTQQAMQATLPGATSTIAVLFTDVRLTQRAADGSFVTPPNRASFGGIFDVFVVLDKLRTVLARWRVGTRDAAWLLERAGQVGWLELHTLPASASAAAVTLSKLDILRNNVVVQQTLVAANESRLFDVVLQRTSARDVVAAALAALGSWASADVIALANRFGWTTGASLVANATAARIRDLLAWPRKLGTDVVTSLTFVTTSVTATEARKVRQLTKAKYDLDKWYAIAGSIQDGLREQKRAALVAWLLANPNAGRGQRWVNLEELYGFYLIDPEMSSCATTTRIKQAAASVQLFVQRCFLQREPSVSVNNETDRDWYQWEWMKRFRLWEANRKIFLYPENWIDPSQRRAKSPFFLSDPRRTFFMSPSFVTTTVYSRWAPSGQTTYTTKYWPTIFYHPFVGTFLQELSYGGVGALYNRRLQTNPDQVRGTAPFNFVTEYQPTDAVRQRTAPDAPYPTEIVDYSHDGAYAIYNWELFFHVPFLIAKGLADNQRFDDALRWFHYIFNPTVTSGGSAPQRYWIPRVFHDLTSEDYARQQIERLLQLVSQGDAELERKIAEWRNDPFDPHLIAASRPVAYQKAVVMQYIATLIAWGDQLFRGDTIESINEATQLYLMASELLGPRPQNLRALQPRQAKTYNELAPQLDDFSNALVDIENVISIPPAMGSPGTTPLPQLHTFYFCIPPNEKLLGYWDTVADRLFKIRHCLNLDGVARPLALYEPPIDPGLLARATAAGVDLATALADIDVAQPCYRFTTVWQVAHDLCQDVRSLGSSILSALERRDAEELSRVRATQEVSLLEAIRAVKTSQLAEARANRAALETSREVAVIRRDYYASREFVNAAEIVGLALSGYALEAEIAATVSDLLAAAVFPIPMFTAGASGFGGSPVTTVTDGGEAAGHSAKSTADMLRSVAATLNQGAGLANSIGGYQRRSDDWDLQRRTAEKEIQQLERQLIAADIRIAVAQQELDAHLRQIDDAKATSELLASKFTNRELYDWILSQLSTTYFQAYQLAYDLAKRASKAYAFELGIDPGYIQFGYWDSLHKGLHAGDKLLLDLRRLQAEHLHRNRRELELTKHVSLAQIDPAALVKLRQTGECFINLPESLFDLDQPGHYMRRLKSVSITLPCVTGPYTGINATLTLVTHATRRSEVPGNQYLPAVDADGVPLASDTRFSRGTGAVQSVALSTGREDSGLFEVNFHDERYLPFEGLGAIGHWRLELPKDCNRFDVSTLSDVVMHLRYTARDGGQGLRNAARQAVVAALPRSGTRLLSARSEFPDAWARLWTPTGSGQRLDLALGEEHFPYIASNHQLKVSAVAAFLLFSVDKTYVDYQNASPASRLKVRMGFATADGSPPAASTTFAPDPNLGQLPVAPLALAGNVGPISLALLETDLAASPLLDQVQTAPDGTTHHRLNRARIDDVLILVSYKIEVRP